MIKLIIVVVLGVIAFVSIMGKIESDANANLDSTATEVTEDKLSVSIDGQVNKVGTYYLNDGSTLSDLVSAAGGLTSNADNRAFNLNYLLKNNLSFYIAPRYDTSETCAQVEITKYNVNTAPSEELQKINGVNSSVATSIVAYRDNGGRFNSIEELKNVTGIGSATLTKMRNFVILK